MLKSWQLNACSIDRRCGKLLVLLMLALFLDAATRADQIPTVSSSGTINFVVADRRGAILVTDSRATHAAADGSLTFSDDATKLYRIDSKTVCSIAGLGFLPGPLLRGFYGFSGAQFIDSGGVILEEAALLHRQSELQPIARKINDIVFDLEMLMDGMVEANSFLSHPRLLDMRRLGFQMLIAGYDTDGLLKIGKVEIQMQQSFPQGAYKANVVHNELETVGDVFRYLVAGYPDATQAISDRLDRPFSIDNKKDKYLGIYRRAVRTNTTGSLTTLQLEQLARHMEDVASKAASQYINGEVQIAVLKQGKVSTKWPANLKIPCDPIATRFISIGVSGLGAMVVSPTAPITVYTNEVCQNSGVQLDRAILIGGDYHNCMFFWDGHPFSRDESAHIDGGSLVLGPNISLGDPLVKRVIQSILPELSQSVVLASTVQLPMPGQRHDLWLDYGSDTQNSCSPQ